MPRILAIDPGITGALAFFDSTAAPDTARLAVYDLPTVTIKKRTHLDTLQLWRMVKNATDHLGATVAVIENVGAMPMQGSGSACNFGKTIGACEMALIAAGCTLTHVTPQQWKFGVGLNAVPGQDQKARKNASRARAQELFPEYAELFARVKDDGRAEAALMAWWFANKRKQA